MNVLCKPGVAQGWLCWPNEKRSFAGSFESKRQRKPTKKLLESNDLDTTFMPKKEWTPPKKVHLCSWAGHECHAGSRHSAHPPFWGS